MTDFPCPPTESYNVSNMTVMDKVLGKCSTHFRYSSFFYKCLQYELNSTTGGYDKVCKYLNKTMDMSVCPPPKLDTCTMNSTE